MTRLVYLAARYSRHPEMREVRSRLESRSTYKVCSRWIDAHGGTLEESVHPQQLNDDPRSCCRYAIVDMVDLRSADVVVSFTGGVGGKGGRHVEFGAAIALGKECYIVGPREHVYHTLPGVIQFDDLDSLCEFLLAIT